MPSPVRNFGLCLSTSCTFLLIASCRNPKQLPTDRPQITAGVTMRDVSFTSAALGREVTYRIFLPTRIDAGAKLPVVYLLHGNGGGFKDWSNNSYVARYAAKGLILVMPEGGGSYFMNAVEKPRDRYEDFVTRDLVGDVGTRFPVRMDREGRAVVGVSMGGFAAVTLALRHPEMFVFSGAISPAIDVPERHFTWRRAAQWWGFRTIFGPWESAERSARDPFVLARSADVREVTYFYLTAGEQEPLQEPIRRFAERLHARGIAYEFHTKPGGHDWAEWDAQIPGCIESLISKLRVDASH